MKTSGMLCDWHVPAGLRGNFHRKEIRPDMTYVAECWLVKKQHIHKMSVAKMRMLGLMCGKTRKNKIRNKGIKELQCY